MEKNIYRVIRNAIPYYTMIFMFERTLSEIVIEESKSFPLLLITCPRQVDKSSLLQMCNTKKSMNYVTLDIAKDIGIDQKTVKAWISILETSGIIYLLRPYYTNLTKRIVKSPKIYFLDTGLCSYLADWVTPLSLQTGAMSEAIFETYVFSEILKSYYHNGKTPNFYYYRDFDKKEIDLVIETGDTIYPIEFKKTASPFNNKSWIRK